MLSCYGRLLSYIIKLEIDERRNFYVIAIGKKTKTQKEKGEKYD